MAEQRRTLSEFARTQLAALFSRLPHRFVVRLAEAICEDRAHGGSGLPHAELLDLLDYQIRRAHEHESEKRKDIETALASAPEEVRKALPFSSFGGFGPNTAPLDLSEPPDAAKFVAAESNVRLLLDIERVAVEYGLGSELSAARMEVAALVRALRVALERELRTTRFAAHAEAYRERALALGREILAPWEVKELESLPKAA